MSFSPSSSSSGHVRDDKVLEPYAYLGQSLGKNVRGVLIDCFQEWLPIDTERMEVIKVSVQCSSSDSYRHSDTTSTNDIDDIVIEVRVVVVIAIVHAVIIAIGKK